MLAAPPEIITDAGAISAAILAVTALLGALSRLPPIRNAWRRQREAIEHERRESHRRLIHEVLAVKVAPTIERLEAKIDAAADQVVAVRRDLVTHMEHEEGEQARTSHALARLADATEARLNDVEGQLAEHLAHHPASSPGRPSSWVAE